MEPLVVFSHGKESGPWGSKIKHLASIAEGLGCRVLSIDYRGIADPEERVKCLEAADLGLYSQLVLAGSSMGGYVATVASQLLQPQGLFLMAPAVYLDSSRYANQDPVPHAEHSLVVFGWNDEVIPVENGIRFARKAKAELHVFDSDHRLMGVLPQIGLLFEHFLRVVLPR